MIVNDFIPLLAQFQITDFAFAIGILMIVIALASWYRTRRQQNPANPAITPTEQVERNKQLRGVRGDLESLMGEIEQFSKRLATHLDAKTGAIETLLKQADQRIAELKRLAKSNGHGESDATTTAATESKLADLPAVETISRSAPEIPDDPLSRSVYQFADQGLPAEAIARKLNEHVGKIELILALRRA